MYTYICIYIYTYICRQRSKFEEMKAYKNNKTFKCYNENTSCDSKWIIYVISCPICHLQYVGQINNFRARMNGHKSDFRLYAAGNINKMDNKLLYDHLISHDIDYFHVSIVDMIHVGNNTDSQLDELLSRKERKWIWDLCSITPYGLNQDDGYYCQNNRVLGSTPGECQFFQLFRCFLSSVLPLRSVGRSNFDKGRHNSNNYVDS